MSSNTVWFIMNICVMLLIIASVTNRVRTEDQCGDELTCLQAQQLLFQKQLDFMQHQFSQIQQMHESDRKIMVLQLELAAKQAEATNNAVSLWNQFISGVFSSVMPLIVFTLFALCVTCYRKLSPKVQEFRSSWIQREADRMMAAHRWNEVSKVFGRLNQLPSEGSSGQSDAHELRDIASGSPDAITV